MCLGDDQNQGTTTIGENRFLYFAIDDLLTGCQLRLGRHIDVAGLLTSATAQKAPRTSTWICAKFRPGLASFLENCHNHLLSEVARLLSKVRVGERVEAAKAT